MEGRVGWGVRWSVLADDVFSLCSLLHSPEEQEANQEETISAVNETINIFSIASGHLYERFLR